MESVIYMPIHWGMEESEIKETVDRTIECYKKLTGYLKQNGMPKPSNKKTQALLEGPKL
jgi:hypothetical protein